MSDAIRESDWKLFRQVQSIALERFCERVLGEMCGVAANVSKTNHERYLAVFKLMKQRDEELANAFENPRRLTALQQLACMQSLGLLTEDELFRFSPEAREVVESLVRIWKD